MEGLMIIILVIIMIVCSLAIFYATIYNKFQDYIIRVNEVESMIDTCLRGKYDLLNKSIPIIKKNLKKDNDKEIFGEIVKLRSRKISNFELYRILVRTNNELTSIKTEEPNITNNDDIIKLDQQLEEFDLKIDNLIDYYNENITIYNSLIKKFPSNIVATFCKYKERLFFDRKDMNDEDYNDFKL